MPRSPVFASFVASPVQPSIGALEVLRFGPFEISKPHTVFYEQTESRWYDGLLGNDAFRGFKVIVDLSKLRIILEPQSR